MIDAKVITAVEKSLEAFSAYGGFDASPLINPVVQVFDTDTGFLEKTALLDEVFDEHPKAEALREVFFDLLLINFFNADVKKLEEDYLDSPEWEEIEEATLERGTEMLNLLLYLNECNDEDIEPGLADYLTEFLLVDEDEFQDEHRIYEPVIANQVLMESSFAEIGRVAGKLPEDAELKEIFYPMMCFFRNPDGFSAGDKEEIAENSFNKDFDMAVLEILTVFAN